MTTRRTNRFEIVGHGRARKLLQNVRCRASRSAARSRAAFWVSFLGDLQNHLETTIVMLPASGRLLLFREAEPVESVPGVLKRLGIRNPARVHIAHFGSARHARNVVTRFAEALSARNADKLILDAWWEGNTLVVLSPGKECFERLRVPSRALLPKVRDAVQRDRENLEIDEHGEFVHWPAVDIHMGWAQFEQAVDPAARLRAQQRSDGFNRRYGSAIRLLRERHELNQQDIKGLTDRTVRRIEKGQTRATANAIRKLAAAHDMAPAEYMTALAQILCRQ